MNKVYKYLFILAVFMSSCTGLAKHESINSLKYQSASQDILSKQRFQDLICSSCVVLSTDIKGGSYKGSGIAFRKKNKTYVITASHVVTSFNVLKKDEEGAVKISEVKSNGNIRVKAVLNINNIDTALVSTDASIIAFNPELDIAILKLKDNLPFASENIIWNKDQIVNVGEEVMAVGHYGNSYKLISDGYVAHHLRILNYANYIMPSVATTIQIEKGASGGFVFNTNKEVVGIINYKSGFSEKISYFIPIKYVFDWLKEEELNYVME